MKKIALLFLGVVVVAGGVAAVSAFEAHIINVTAHIENALGLDTSAIAFGTVFPQEYVTRGFKVSLSSSFLAQCTDPAVPGCRVDEVNYKIEQKPKPIWPKPTPSCTQGYTTEEEARVYCKANPSDTNCCYKDLCKFLSKISTDAGTVSEPSYFHPAVVSPSPTPAFCATPSPAPATGNFDLSDADALKEHNWLVDLKVPPVKGFVGQDWPASCASYTVPTDGADYGCDLWIEVTGIGKPL